MKYGRYGLSYVFLRLGLAVTFVWIGIDIFRNPTTWIGFVPLEPGFGLSQEAALRVGGAADLAIGLMLMLRTWTKLAGWLVAIHMIGIIIFNGMDAVLIRDVGLLGAGLALAFWPAKYHRRKVWGFSFGKKKSSSSEE